MFLTTIAWGANLFITIVVILIAFGAGLTVTDFLKTKKKEEEWQEAENEAEEVSDTTSGTPDTFTSESQSDTDPTE